MIPEGFKIKSKVVVLLLSQGPYGVQGVKTGLAPNKESTLPTVLIVFLIKRMLILPLFAGGGGRKRI